MKRCWRELWITVLISLLLLSLMTLSQIQKHVPISQPLVGSLTSRNHHMFYVFLHASFTWPTYAQIWNNSSFLLSPAGEYNLHLGIIKELHPDMVATYSGRLYLNLSMLDLLLLWNWLIRSMGFPCNKCKRLKGLHSYVVW